MTSCQLNTTAYDLMQHLETDGVIEEMKRRTETMQVGRRTKKLSVTKV